MVRAVCIADAHHIHMRLQNRARRTLATWRGVLFHDDVVAGVLNDAQALRARPAFQVIADGLFPLGGPGDGGKRSKGVQNIRGVFFQGNY